MVVQILVPIDGEAGRLSPHEQRRERQRRLGRRAEEACRAWAEREQHEVVAVHSDRGLSGKLGPEDRPGLAAALNELEGNRAEGLVVHRLDRFARELHVQEAALARAWTAGGRIFEAVEGEVQRDDPDDPMRTFVRQVWARRRSLSAA